MKEHSEKTEIDVDEDEKKETEAQAAEESVEQDSSNADEVMKKAEDIMLNMKKEIKKKEEEIGQLKDLLMRRQADFENYKKQSLRQDEIKRRMLIKDIAVDIISINDNLIRASDAAEHVPEGESLEHAHKSYVEGVMMISKSIEEMLKKYGIEEIEAMNEHFNPNMHEAVEISMSEEVAEDTVTKVFQKGFKLEDFIIRSTKVCVTKPVPKPLDSAADSSNGDSNDDTSSDTEKSEEDNNG
jgi:molecular chaperone GrpE